MELVHLNRVVQEQYGAANSERHHFITHYLHGGTVLFVGVMYLAEHVNHYQGWVNLLQAISKKLLGFWVKDIHTSRLVFRMKHVDVVWEMYSAPLETEYPVTPDSLTGVKLEVQD